MPDTCYPASGGLIGVDQAIAQLLNAARPVPEVEAIPVEEGLGRVLARSLHSPIDVPGHDNSAMDGYALRAADTADGRETRLRLTQRITAGTQGTEVLPGTAARIFTGAPVPPGSDAVIMQEEVRQEDDSVILARAVRPGENIRPRGNDIGADTEILPGGTRMGPQHMGLIASVGLAIVPVHRRLRVGIVFTGDELVSPGEPLPPGHIYNSNRYTLTGLLRALGCEVTDLGLVPDDLAATRAALRAAAVGTDLVLTSGGVSVGEEDHVRRAVEAEGSVDLWKIAIKPGKPFAYGRVGDTAFMGLPGNSVSVFVTFLWLVRPYLLRRMGATNVLPMPIEVAAGFEWRKPRPRREFVRVRLVPTDRGGRQAVPYPKQGSDVLTSAVWADGLVEIPEHVTIERGAAVRYYPLAELLG